VYTVRQGNGSATTLSLKVFPQKNFVAELIALKLIFIHKNYIFTF